MALPSQAYIDIYYAPFAPEPELPPVSPPVFAPELPLAPPLVSTPVTLSEKVTVYCSLLALFGVLPTRLIDDTVGAGGGSIACERPLRQKRGVVQSLTRLASALAPRGCHTPYICPDLKNANLVRSTRAADLISGILPVRDVPLFHSGVFAAGGTTSRSAG